MAHGWESSRPHDLSDEIRLIPTRVRPRQQFIKLVKLFCQVGFAQFFRGDSVRRVQFLLSNHVASTVQRLTGDTFPELATGICQKKKYSIWLPNELFLNVSRVSPCTILISIATVQLDNKNFHWLHYQQARQTRNDGGQRIREKDVSAETYNPP